MLNKIKALAKASQELEPNQEARASFRKQVIAHSENFLENIEESPAYVLTADQGIGLLESPLQETGITMQTALDLVGHNVDRPGLNPASGGHLGYIPGGGIYLSALGDYLADITNRYAGIFFPNPGAVRMENMMIRWMAQLVGYPKTAAGTLLSGGSLANLTCIVTARDAQGIRAREVERAVIYLTTQAHHCITKSLRIAGLGEAIVRYVPLDPHFRMDSKALAKLVETDLAQGLKPFLIVAAAGTTDTGAVDPIDQIADIAQAHNIWLHVDAAYGGFFLLCEEGRKIITGLHRSDSIVMDPHKGLFLPYGTGAAIVKDGKRLAESHHYTANYLQDARKYDGEMSPADLSPELTRHFRGLRMWLPLKVHGLAPFRASIEEKLWLSRWFREQLMEIPNMEVGPFPDLSVVLYRYLPSTGDANQFNEKLTQRIHEDGRIFLSSTKIDGIFYLRLACLSFRTHLHTLQQCLQMIQDCIQQVQQETLEEAQNGK
ncbi:MAG TPA: aminotransferase class I/II-fold pyridoxal phosphate-dependent enzyme [Bacteroidetes bacterium]|nr:aminotransferase class I/II-fold pyridoxal phosphate-dependent enzyme [Bacteroidota bacterium]